MPSFGFCGHQAHMWCTGEDTKEQSRDRAAPGKECLYTAAPYTTTAVLWRLWNRTPDSNLCSLIWNTCY